MARDGGFIERDIPAPAWRQVADYLRSRIRAGEWEPGHAIASETQVRQELGCARGTVRRAVAELRGEGLVVTVPGRGTYVADPLPPEG